MNFAEIENKMSEIKDFNDVFQFYLYLCDVCDDVKYVSYKKFEVKDNSKKYVIDVESKKIYKIE